MTDQSDRAQRFRDLHVPGRPLLMPNAWDAGSARILESLGFLALATTSSGFAATLGRKDQSVTRDEALQHCADLVAATDLPVSADLENGFADDPAGVAETARLAHQAGLAGFSIEDHTGDPDNPIYDLDVAADRVAAAARVAHAGPMRLVLTGRAENYLYGRDDLKDTIARLRAYQEAGADVLFAPGVQTAEEIRQIIEAVDRPLSVLGQYRTPPVSELAKLGVSRVSVGGAFKFAALSALAEAAEELRERGTYRYLERSRAGAKVALEAFEPKP